MTSNLTRVQEPAAARRLRNTAEPSRELSVGDIVSVGEVPLTAGHVGWILVRSGLKEVRTDEHGTHALPADFSGKEPNQP
jgi:hypothetical protein